MPVPFRPAVFACPSRISKKPERVWTPPYPAWPELTNPSTFYTLPALGLYNGISMALYWPPQCYWNSKDRLYSEHVFENIDAIKNIHETIGLLKFSRFMANGIGALRTKSVDHHWDVFAYFHDLSSQPKVS
jgi:hypothetical protein